MAVGDIYKLSVVGRFGLGQQFVNTFHYRQVATQLLTTDVQLLFDDFFAQALTPYRAVLPGSMIVDIIEVRQVLGGLAAQDFPVALGGAGGIGEELPPMNCELISWRTGLIGRANRGRTYLPAMLETAQSGGTLTAGAIATVQNFANNAMTLHDVITGLITQFQMVIWHTTLADSPDVTSGLVRNLMATQRRRRVGVGS